MTGGFVKIGLLVVTGAFVGLGRVGMGPCVTMGKYVGVAGLCVTAGGYVNGGLVNGGLVTMGL